MSTRNDAFNTWYDATFGAVLGAEDNDNREAVRKIWNGVLEHVAKQYEFQLLLRILLTRLRRCKVFSSWFIL